MDLTTLADPAMLGLALAFVAVASLGKTAGALMGGHLAGLSWRESLALATGLNARGSTEVIIATIGLSLGVLSEPLYTLIVAMAIITTIAMPPTLRWALTRVPMRDEERVRLEKEEAAENDYLPAMERVLVLADRSANARLVLGLAGAFAAGQQIQTTILAEQPEAEGADDPAADRGTERARAAAEQVDGRLAGGGAGRNAGGEEEPAEARAPAESLIRSRALGEEDSAETKKTSPGPGWPFTGGCSKRATSSRTSSSTAAPRGCCTTTASIPNIPRWSAASWTRSTASTALPRTP
jgi:hypothetical protein